MATTLLTEKQLLKLLSFFRSYYRDNGRCFPWRSDRSTPFEILVAEMLLRQTRAEQVVAVWTSVLRKYPDPYWLSSSEPEALFEIVRPLGLGTQQAIALNAMSTDIVERFQGRVPRRLSELTSLPHIGMYCANAVACFGYRKRVPIVDSNVLRLFSRLTDIDYGKDNKRSADILALAWEILPRRAFVEHNYGVLDFSAQVCRPRGALHTEMCAERDLRLYGFFAE